MLKKIGFNVCINVNTRIPVLLLPLLVFFRYSPLVFVVCFLILFIFYFDHVCFNIGKCKNTQVCSVACSEIFAPMHRNKCMKTLKEQVKKKKKKKHSH
jgi:hypothetical protein